MTERKILPKLIVVVVEEDIIQYLKFKLEKAKVQAEPKFKKAISWLMREFVKSIDIYKEFLPAKAKKDKIPHILWIQPVTNVNFHNNKEREKFGMIMKSNSLLFNNTTSLRLLQIWDVYDRNLYLEHQRRFTHEGKVQYWRAIDKTVRFCDTNILKKAVQNAPGIQKGRPQHRNLSWKNNNSKRGKTTPVWKKNQLAAKDSSSEDEAVTC